MISSMDFPLFRFTNASNILLKKKLGLEEIGKPMNDEFDFSTGIASVENKLTLVTDNLTDFANIENI